MRQIRFILALLIGISLITKVQMKFKKQNLVIALNCGSQQSEKDSFGILYKKDKDYIKGGVPSSYGCTHRQYWLTPDVNIYCSQRYGDNEDLIYQIPVKSPGKYVVNLKFSQVVFFNANEKVFDIGIGDQKVLTDLDIYQAVGSFEPIDIFIELEISSDNTVQVYSITDSKTHEFEKPLTAKEGYQKQEKKLVIKILKGRADNPKINGIVITKGGLEDSLVQNYVKMKNQIMKERQAILEKRQKREELDSGQYNLKQPFDGERQSIYEMEHSKSIFNKCLEIPYLFQGMMGLFVLVFFYIINKMPDNKENDRMNYYIQ